MKRRKILPILIAMGLAFTALAGCGKDTEKAADTSNTAPTADTKEDTKAEGEASEAAADKAAAEEVDPYGPVSDETTIIHVGRAESANVTYKDGKILLTTILLNICRIN